jgi:DNA ligase (NAD+)
MKKDIKKIGQEMVLLGTFEDYTIEEIIEVLRAADDLYYNDESSFLEDNEYDALRKYAQMIDPRHTYFLGVGSNVRGGKVKLPFEMGSLDQVDVGEITDWVGNWMLRREQLVITDKLDGISAMIVYNDAGQLQIAYSRGNGIEGADITRHIRLIPSVPEAVSGPMVIRGEIIIKKDDFPTVQSTVLSRSRVQYKNARNAVAGLMNAKKNDQRVYEFIQFVAYEIVGKECSKLDMLRALDLDKFLTPEVLVSEGNELTDLTLSEYLNTRRKHSPYEIDGVVIDVDSLAKRKQMNPTKDTLNPAYAIKFKVADAFNRAVAEVVGVEWSASKHGYLKPTICIQPVNLVGVTITRCTGFNAKFIRDGGIGRGAKIEITRAGDVIPFCKQVIKSTTPDMPDGEWEWNETGVDAVLIEHNDDVTVNRLTDFFASIDAPHLKKGNVAKLYAAGYTTIENIIKASASELVKILGENGDKVYRGLQTKLTDIPLFKLIGAHASARGIGIRKMKKLQQALGAEGLYQCNDIDLVAAQDGFDYKTAQKVVQCISEFKDFYAVICDCVTIADDNMVEEGSMKDQKVVFTGFRDKELEAAVEAEGGEMQNAVSGRTTIVVTANPNSNSGKVKKARDLGVKIVSIDEFKEMVQ